MKILIIDDDTFVLEMVKMMLRGRHEVYTAENTSRGFQIIFNQKIDLIILDWMMPEMDGLSMLVAIKSDDRYSGIPVIFLSGKTKKTDLERAMAHGAADYIKKPFRKSELIDCIDSIAGKIKPR